MITIFILGIVLIFIILFIFCAMKLNSIIEKENDKNDIQK